MHSRNIFRRSMRTLWPASLLGVVNTQYQFFRIEARAFLKDGVENVDANRSVQKPFGYNHFLSYSRQSDTVTSTSLRPTCRHFSATSSVHNSENGERNGVKASQPHSNGQEEDEEEDDEFRDGVRDMDIKAKWDGDLQDESADMQEEDVESAEEAVAQADGETSIFSLATSLSELKKSDINKYFTLKPEDKEKFFGEGLPAGLAQEFEATNSASFQIRHQMLQLCERLGQSLTAPEPRKYYLLDGPVGSGKSITLAMLVMWARSQGWLVFYVPFGKEWTHGGMYSKNERTGLWDTPLYAKNVLEGFLRSHEEILGQLKCRVFEPLYLGEVPGLPPTRGPQHTVPLENASLRDLIQQGLVQPHLAVATVVRLREELILVKEVPVLFAIDQFNSWFTFSEYHEYMGPRNRRPIHARELAMVNAFRRFEDGPFYVSSFSHSTAVGKLPRQLPGVPPKVRFRIHHFNLKETSLALDYYHMQKVASNAPTKQDVSKLFFLTNGNGRELRNLAHLL